MFRILVVDDEKTERDGIAFLIRKHELPFEVAQAVNGEQAQEVLRSQPVDILFTDIKMPFMDGLELSAWARRHDPDLCIVIYSAFADFQYARTAMDFQAVDYVLKPLQVNEFLTVMNKCIAMRKEKLGIRSMERTIQQQQEQALAYAHEKQLLDVLLGHLPAERAEFGWSAIFGERVSRIQLMLIDVGHKLFDTGGLGLNKELASLVAYPAEYLNLNEFQSVLFVKLPRGTDTAKPELLYDAAQAIRNYLRKHGATSCHVVVGRPAAATAGIAAEFSYMEQQLEYKFFFPDGMILLDEYPSRANLDEQFVEQTLETIKKLADDKDYAALRKSVELLFDALKGSERHSSIYLKYICTEIIRGVFERSQVKASIVDTAEKIYKTGNIVQLERLVDQLIEQVQAEPGHAGEYKKAVDDVKSIIAGEYASDLSLEQLAARVYLSPSYLSFLFRKETGETLMKYITRVRMKKAGELLRGTHMKIVQVSKEVGYANDSYFSSLFKSHYGKTPAKFREEG